MKVKLIKPHHYGVVGSVVDVREGIARTLVSFKVAEYYVEPKLDAKSNDKPKRASSKSGRGKKSS